LKLANESHGLSRKGFTREAAERMLHYAWPGNVRELRNVVQSTAVLGKGSYLTVEDLPSELTDPGHEARPLPMAYGEQGQYPGGSGDPLLAHTLFSLAADLKEVLRRLDQLEARMSGVSPSGSDPEHWRKDASVAEVTPIKVDVSGDLESAEKTVIQASLSQNGGNRRQTAEQLGISERTLYRKLRRYGLG
jgi:DNA-binding NtrC family response regulator